MGCKIEQTMNTSLLNFLLQSKKMQPYYMVHEQNALQYIEAVIIRPKSPLTFLAMRQMKRQIYAYCLMLRSTVIVTIEQSSEFGFPCFLFMAVAGDKRKLHGTVVINPRDSSCFVIAEWRQHKPARGRFAFGISFICKVHNKQTSEKNQRFALVPRETNVGAQQFSLQPFSLQFSLIYEKLSSLP